MAGPGRAAELNGATTREETPQSATALRALLCSAVLQGCKSQTALPSGLDDPLGSLPTLQFFEPIGAEDEPRAGQSCSGRCERRRQGSRQRTRLLYGDADVHLGFALHLTVSPPSLFTPCIPSCDTP